MQAKNWWYSVHYGKMLGSHYPDLEPGRPNKFWNRLRLPGFSCKVQITNLYRVQLWPFIRPPKNCLYNCAVRRHTIASTRPHSREAVLVGGATTLRPRIIVVFAKAVGGGVTHDHALSCSFFSVDDLLSTRHARQ